MRAFGWIVVGAMVVASATAEYPKAEVFTSAQYPITTDITPGVQVYRLDAPARLEGEITARLPSDPSEAYAFAEEALKVQWREQAKRLTETYQGVLKARQYGLQKLPAIVFDGRAVVYGVTDLEQALGDYRRWQGAR
jgi:integrating conjugative element protein (TIGR03757 family)